ncbi:MAG: hypothetical protein DRO11_09105 [Methanobacteriota archaeon]|nr:MAG: hypothetical protein DRO11_09105 [Euryarchaeota archaeon]
MFGKRKQRKKIEQGWRNFVSIISNIAYPVEKSALDNKRLSTLSFIELVSDTQDLYANKNKVTKRTLQLLSVAKRLLADKRNFDAVKCIDYLLLGHSVFNSKSDKELREKVVAHFWRIISNYLEIIKAGSESNPMAPGVELKRGE